MNKWKDQFPKEDRYFETESGILYNADCLDILKQFPNEVIDLGITSPPYDNLRTYNKNIDKLWDFTIFKKIAKELTRILKQGGVIVWVVNDATIKGSETGTSFRQALYFKDNCGLNLHDTMIFKKKNPRPFNHNRYEQCFEYMFILSKGKPKTFNPIKILTKSYHRNDYFSQREKNGEIRISIRKKIKREKIKTNIWEYSVGFQSMTKSKVAFTHPAIFPYNLAYDHILSWSNENDIILDPFMGSGTVKVASNILNRKWIGIEINKEYCYIIKNRQR